MHPLTLQCREVPARFATGHTFVCGRSGYPATYISLQNGRMMDSQGELWWGAKDSVLRARGAGFPLRCGSK
ncbi:hypothetical protein J6590_076824 [Homalodisca vitripennis]|nr:hypothetical protein J6590_076824 [Homalodisca vitripennis]